ncbi:class I SAM-dependent methyltransferase [Microseira wollei]|uniref:dTDP-3-amino-3,4, 6-trideoxy-alpha-D-glucopyranose n=1 Tax=Microseira wollei NIES-4236 TaxID=2530354 RepID=A0AAV3X6Z5_9CYAN|nr:class I SAM-dependent methyltransferase [Microseira wollei]GET38108.1 dTDP-3-amino-3,4, 6-trideoxy-alpha-D-glucopyranose [Microseira wollei NIES-4236]
MLITQQLDRSLYSQIELHEQIYSALDIELSKMCQRMFVRYLQRVPSSILDIRCGLGRELNALSRICPNCVGIDDRLQIVRSAQFRYPNLTFKVGDTSSFRLQQRFDGILSLRWAINYALTNRDLDRRLQTYADHAKTGTLLILEALNGDGYMPENRLNKKPLKSVSERFYGEAIAKSIFRQRQHFLDRQRIWNLPGEKPIEDYCRYRLFSSKELELLLAKNGFQVVGMFDNRDLDYSDLWGTELYVAAIFQG